MIRITDIIDTVLSQNPDARVDIIEKAYVYSARVHDGQVRLSGEPYLYHPMEVAGILAKMRLDEVSVAAALLHDVIEDTHATAEDIEQYFGPEVRHLVSGVTKLSALPVKSSKVRQAESLRKMILAMADDIRVILIKLADRLHNMRTLRFHKSDAKKKKIAQETLDIYAPIASRLGIYWMKKELEDTSFMYTQPEDYERIEARLEMSKEKSEAFIRKTRAEIEKELAKSGLKGEVKGRFKHTFSIYQKMLSQNLSFEEIYDIIAFRIILDTISQCYEALGVLHAKWRPIAKKFKDYIGFPKPNMYQSLHTTVIGPKGERVEVQIRTHQMDYVASSGIAAHWGYKEGKTVDENISKKFAWIQNLVENQANVRNPSEFMENVRIDLFPEEIYVFTPAGDIKSLSRGSTPVDFAYAIHSEVGNQCSGAKVNGRMVPLHHELTTGDVVEVLTSKNHRPSKDWLNFVQTVKARARIRQWIKHEEKERSLPLGREMLEKSFRKYRLNLSDFLKSDEIEKVSKQFGFKSVDELIASVGYGKITPLQVVKKVQPKPEEKKSPDEIASQESAKLKAAESKAKGGVSVTGMDDILIRYGKCCKPVPGDSIVGYITRGRGVTVHRANCVNALQLNPERQVDVDWTDAAGETYPVRIRIRSYDRVGLLADVAANISKAGANILKVHSETGDHGSVESVFTVSVKSTEHINLLVSSLKKVKHVRDVVRLEH